MRFIVVLQLPSDRMSDFDSMIAAEELLLAGLSPNHEVDGHDVGSGEVNVFIRTDDPLDAAEQVHRALSESPIRERLRIAYREEQGENYEVLWPPGLSEFSVS